MIYPAPVRLCDLDFSARGLLATVVGGQVSILPTATVDEVAAVLAFLEVAIPCTHTVVSEPQRCASDVWLDYATKLYAIPSGSDYDAIRTRYEGLVAAALDRANALGGLV